MTNKNIIIAVAVVTLGILSRTVLHLGANIEIITALTICSSFFFSSKRLALLVPLSIMIVSDLIIGNSLILLFTWSAFLLIPLLVWSFKKIFAEKSFVQNLLVTTSTGIFSVVIFYLWTNLGVVFVGNWYTHDLQGIIQSYINALPFLKPQLISTLIFTPILFTLGWVLFEYKQNIVLVGKKLIK